MIINIIKGGKRKIKEKVIEIQKVTEKQTPLTYREMGFHYSWINRFITPSIKMSNRNFQNIS